MTVPYLEALDGLLGLGLRGFSRGLRELQAAFVCSTQQADGGFRGRQGTSDTYYTDFALRVLSALPQDEAERPASPGYALDRAAAFLRSAPHPRDAVQCFSILNSARILRKAGLGVPLQTESIAATLEAQRLPAGGYCRPGGTVPSAYHSFLAALSLQMLDRPLPAAEDAARAIANLQGDGGGFREQDDARLQQTNATAAALGLLSLVAHADPAAAQAAIGFLAGMQAPDGGLRAHAEAHGGDLLSTFTGLLTLAGMDAIDAIDLGALGRFVRSTARPQGGFGAAALDPGADVEYAYYGIGCLALLRMAADGRWPDA